MSLDRQNGIAYTFQTMNNEFVSFFCSVSQLSDNIESQLKFTIPRRPPEFDNRIKEVARCVSDYLNLFTLFDVVIACECRILLFSKFLGLVILWKLHVVCLKLSNCQSKKLHSPTPCDSLHILHQMSEAEIEQMIDNKTYGIRFSMM